jgi:hypothetical protein
LVNRQTKKDPLAPSQKVLKRHKKKAHRLSMRHRHLKKSKQASIKNNSYKSPTRFLQNCRRLYKANNLRPEATRDEFAATPLTVSRKQMFIPVHAKRGGFAAPFSASARKQPLSGTAAKHSSRKAL